MKDCGRRNKDGTCPELTGRSPSAKIQAMYGIPLTTCMFCVNDMAEICSKYLKV